MKRTLLLLLLAMFSFESVAQSDSQKASFVSDFYIWYSNVSITSFDTHKDAAHEAITHKPQIFAPALLHALKVDDEHRLRAKGVLDSLDFDPILNSQDPPPHYVVAGISNNRVRVVGDRPEFDRVLIDVIVNCTRTCTIENFVYPAQDGKPELNLLQLLHQLHPHELPYSSR